MEPIAKDKDAGTTPLTEEGQDAIIEEVKKGDGILQQIYPVAERSSPSIF